jgi:hypothetical protein
MKWDDSPWFPDNEKILKLIEHIKLPTVDDDGFEFYLDDKLSSHVMRLHTIFNHLVELVKDIPYTIPQLRYCHTEIRPFIYTQNELEITINEFYYKRPLGWQNMRVITMLAATLTWLPKRFTIIEDIDRIRKEFGSEMGSFHFGIYDPIRIDYLDSSDSEQTPKRHTDYDPIFVDLCKNSLSDSKQILRKSIEYYRVVNDQFKYHDTFNYLLYLQLIYANTKDMIQEAKIVYFIHMVHITSPKYQQILRERMGKEIESFLLMPSLGILIQPLDYLVRQYYGWLPIMDVISKL